MQVSHVCIREHLFLVSGQCCWFCNSYIIIIIIFPSYYMEMLYLDTNARNWVTIFTKWLNFDHSFKTNRVNKVNFFGKHLNLFEQFLRNYFDTITSCNLFKRDCKRKPKLLDVPKIEYEVPSHNNNNLKVCNKNLNPQLMFLICADIHSIMALLKA